MEKNSEFDLSRWVDDRLATLRPDGDWQPDAVRGLDRLRELRAARSGRRRRWTLAVAAAVAACLVLMAFPAPRALAERCVAACLSESIQVRQLLWPSPPGPVRAYAPDFNLTDASGKQVKLSDYRGKVVLLNFWATWCPPCRVEIPWFIEFQRTYGDRDFVVLGVSFDEDGWKAVQPFMEENKINYPVVIGGDDIAALYGGLSSLPTTLIIDKSGRIATTHVGLVSKGDYEAGIRAMLANP
ncbi:MAG: TlpA family protein disulfide reductase [Acidobacteria bacterium]|nr:TlpA family protein disulfide reductase [Acidobacteriota bacterium]